MCVGRGSRAARIGAAKPTLTAMPIVIVLLSIWISLHAT
jgi:hypothetical protein